MRADAQPDETHAPGTAVQQDDQPAPGSEAGTPARLRDRADRAVQWAPGSAPVRPPATGEPGLSDQQTTEPAGPVRGREENAAEAQPPVDDGSPVDARGFASLSAPDVGRAAMPPPAPGVPPVAERATAAARSTAPASAPGLAPLALRPARPGTLDGGSALGGAGLWPDARSARRAQAAADGRVSGGTGPLASLLRRPLLALAPVVLLLIPTLAASLLSAPSYRAEAQILVGRVDVESGAVPGFVNATQSLAATYARLVATTTIVERVAESLDVPVEQVQGRISASPVPESSLIEVTAEAPSEPRAVALAGATSEELIAYLLETNDDPGRQRVLLDEYEEAAEELRRTQAALESAEAALAGASPAQADELRTAAAQARAAVDRAQLRNDASAAAYSDSQRGAVDRGALQLVSAATPAGNDRASRVQLAVLASVVVGGLLGVGLVTLVENRGRLRQVRNRTPEAS